MFKLETAVLLHIIQYCGGFIMIYFSQFKSVVFYNYFLKAIFFFLMLLYGATLYSILYPLVCWSFGLSAWEIISSTNNHSPDYFLYLPFLRACCFCWILVTVVIKYVYFIIVFYFLYLLFWFLFIVLLVSHHIVILLGDSVHRWILIFIPFIKTEWPST